MEHFKIDKEINKAVMMISKSQNYQKQLFIFLCLMYVQIALNALINPIIFTNPLFKCNKEIESQSYACVNGDKCNYQNKFTATYYTGLYCQHRQMRMTIQSIFGVGSIFGTLIIPTLSDIWGRWFATNASLLSMLFGNLFILLGIIVGSFQTIGLGMFLSAFGSLAMDAISYSLSTDFLVGQTKQKALIYFYLIWGLTDIPVSIIWFIIPYWLFFIFFLLLVPITLLYFTFRCFFMQSIYFLVHAKKQLDNIIPVLQQIAKINHATQYQLQQAKYYIKQVDKNKYKLVKQQPTLKQKLKIMFTTTKYLKSFIYITFIKMSSFIFYYGVQGCLERIGFNLGVSIFIFGLGQVTGYVVGYKFVPKQSRKTAMLVGSLTTAAIGVSYSSELVKKTPLLATLILYCILICDCYKFSALCLIQSQSFGSSIRSTAVGTSFSASYTVRLFIPFFIGYFNQRDIHPIIASSIMMISIGIIPIVMIQQTYSNSQIKQPFQQNYVEEIQMK